MFKISEHKDYLTANTSLKDLGLEYDTIGKLCIQGRKGFESAILEIKQWLEAHYRMYQYKKGNGVKYGEHELFYWHNCNDSLYFTVDIEHSNVDDAKRIADEIVAYITAEHHTADGYVSLQYESVLRWGAINQFVMEMDTSDKDVLPLNALARIARKGYLTGHTLTLESRDKLHELELELLGAMCGKKVCIDTGGMGQPVKGTLHQLAGGQFAVFKPRATRTYYPVSLGNIANLKIA